MQLERLTFLFILTFVCFIYLDFLGFTQTVFPAVLTCLLPFVFTGTVKLAAALLSLLFVNNLEKQKILN